MPSVAVTLAIAAAFAGAAAYLTPVPLPLLLGATIKLSYFDARGRAEAIRLALHDRKVAFQDSTFSPEEWRAGGLKAKLTAEGKLAYGQVPLLTVGATALTDPVHIVQSHAILRFLGRAYGFYSFDATVLASVDQASDGTEDARKGLMAIKYGGGTDAEKDAKYKTYFEGDPDTNVEAVAPKWFAFYETMLVRSKTPFLGGSGDVSMADFLLYDLLDNHEGQQPDRTRALLLPQDGVSRFPALVAWRARIASRPNIAAYLASPNRRKR